MERVNVSQAILVAGGLVAVCFWLRSIFVHSPFITRLREECPSLEHTSAHNEPTQSSGQTGAIQLRLVHSPSEDESETDIDIDIIAIHGLDTKSPDTWTWKDPKDPDSPGVNWLEHKDMLPKSVGSARIFTCDWPADLYETSELIQKTIEEFARLLLNGIQGHVREDRPILFIASCLGGIILIKALDMATAEYSSIKKATRAVIFLATPFRGTSFQDVARWAEPGLKTWASIRSRKVTKLLDNVKGSTFDLSELVRNFTQLCKDQDYIVDTFYEKGYTDLSRKIPCLPNFLGASKKQVKTMKRLSDMMHWIFITFNFRSSLNIKDAIFCLNPI